MRSNSKVATATKNSKKEERKEMIMNFCDICREKVCPGDKNRLSFTRVDGSVGWIHGACFVKSIKKNIGEVTDIFDDQLRGIEDLALLVTDPVKEEDLYDRYQKLLDQKYHDISMHDTVVVQKYLKALIVYKGDKLQTLETILDDCEVKIYKEIDRLLKAGRLVWFEDVQRLMSLISATCDLCITKLNIRRKLFDQARLDQIREQLKYMKN